MADWAKLMAFHLDDANAAQQLLDRAVEMPGLARDDRSEIKLALGDVLVFQDDIWSASLLFSQVDLDHKEASWVNRPSSATPASATSRETSIGPKPSSIS